MDINLKPKIKALTIAFSLIITLFFIASCGSPALLFPDFQTSYMSKSLDDIVKAIEDSFAPFLESIQNLAAIDDKTSAAIDKMAEAADNFVKISEPQAKLAKGAAVLIEESVGNIRSIASWSLSILELELNKVINEAVEHLVNETASEN